MTRRLDRYDIPYAVIGGAALAAHGYARPTADIDMIVSHEGLSLAHEYLEGLGYRAPFPSSNSLKDNETGVLIEFLLAGDFPGDGKPKPVFFPDPRRNAVTIQDVNYVSLPALFELKLAAAMTQSERRKDFQDVVGLIRARDLVPNLSRALHPYVRQAYRSAWKKSKGMTP